MSIIDFRLRPPVPAFVGSMLYAQGPVREMFYERVGLEEAPSVKARSMDLLIEEMDAADVKMGLVMGRRSSLFGSIDNDVIAGILDAHSGRFIGAAAINPLDAKESIKSIQQAMARGFKAVNIEPGICDVPMYVDDRRLYPIYGYCEENKIPTIIMAGGLAGPDATCTSPERIDRVCSDFPAMKVAISHGGYPWVTEVLQVVFCHPNLYLSTDVYFYNFPGMDDYVKAADGYLCDRFLYGSAYPIGAVQSFAEWFQTLPIRPESMERVLYRNAAEFLGIN